MNLKFLSNNWLMISGIIGPIIAGIWLLAVNVTDTRNALAAHGSALVEIRETAKNTHDEVNKQFDKQADADKTIIDKIDRVGDVVNEMKGKVEEMDRRQAVGSPPALAQGNR